MCLDPGNEILAACSLETASSEHAQPGNPSPDGEAERKESCATQTERDIRMSNQPKNEALTPREQREPLLAELEASQQELAELSNEQLAEIAGGFLPITKMVESFPSTPAEIVHNGATVINYCCAGAIAGTILSGTMTGAVLGGGIGLRVAAEVIKNRRRTLPSSQGSHPPQGDLEAGTAHAHQA
jgi:hypothetical protein